MDEQNYRDFYRQLNEMPCVFEKAILSQRASCRHGHKLNLAEREAVACQFTEARDQCAQLLGEVAEKARFALHKRDDEPLTHGQAMKVQLGGLQGLQAVLDDHATQPEISQLTFKANLRFPMLSGLPVDEIVRAIVHYKVRGGR